MTKIQLYSSYQDTGFCPANVSRVVFLDTEVLSTNYDGVDKVRECLRKGQGPELIRELSDLHQVDYAKFRENVAPILYYCWDPKTINALKNVLDTTGAKIVLSSDLRFAFSQSDMADLFKIHGLAEYYVDNIGQVIDDNETTKFFTNKYGIDVCHWRTWEILEYLERCPQIKSYVVLDEMYLNPGLGDRFFRDFTSYQKDMIAKIIQLLQTDM
ncbi:MAG: hypothetical protein LBI10_12550 [Deltaproteobacteria bacterium]|jgi:hypothetical protein|nr:hypothetical protein [Deltaproteobacteria bacterium]